MKMLNKLLSAALSLAMLVSGVQGISANAEEPVQTHESKLMHISFDDVYACLYDITEKEYTSAFENPMLADLKKLHEEYGAVFTLNCFIKSSKQSNYDIAKLPSRYKDELSSCADWLRFAFHAQDDNTRYDEDCAEEIAASYKIFTDAVLNLTGNPKSIDTVTRLGFFTGNDANVSAIKNCDYGITGLLTADDERVSYYFSEYANSFISTNNECYDIEKGFKLIQTQKRLEGVKDTAAELQKLNEYTGDMIEVFTHESEYSQIKSRLSEYVKWAKNHGIGFGFAQDYPVRAISANSVKQTGKYITYNLKIKALGSNARVICAVYDKDKTLTDIQLKPIQQTVDFTTKEASGGRVKFMLWNSLEGMIPLSEPLELSAETKPSPTPQPESKVITLNKTNYPLVVGNKSKTDFSDWETRGSSVQLAASVNSERYSASDITWESADESIATVSSSGKVRGRTSGFTEIYAKLPDGDRAVCSISVIDNVTRITVQSLEFNTDELNMSVGASAELIPIINPKDVFNNGMLNSNLTWSSTNESVASVSNGKITAKSKGTAVIKAVSADIGRSAECVVSVSDTARETEINAQTSAFDMTVGEKRQLDAQCESEIIWKSENSYIADVDSEGVVTAYSNSSIPKLGTDGQTVFEDGITVYDKGTVNIIATAKNGGYTKRFTISVADNKMNVQDVALNKKDINIAAGDTGELTAAVLPSNMFDKRVLWSSSDESIALVSDSGRNESGVCRAEIKAVKTGNAVITASCGDKSASCSVNVTAEAVRVSEINITNAKNLDIDEVYELSASVTENAVNKELAWISTDKNILTVNNEGIVKGYKAGTAKVYAIAVDSVEDKALLDELIDLRAAGKDSRLSSFLSSVVYGECEITVNDSSPYLRNLHIPTETITDNSVNLLWNRASKMDCSDLQSYEIYQNGELVADTEKLGYTAKDLNPETRYTFTVTAKSSDGQELLSKEISVTTKPKSEIINVLDYGAVGNGRVMDTFAIQKAIDACPSNGTVLLPKGYIFYSGALFLKSNMTFKVDGILMGSPYGKDYSPVITRWEGWRKLNQTSDKWANTTTELPDNHHPYASLLNAGTYDEGVNSHTGPYNVENIVICGSGQINANGFRLGYNEGLNQKTGSGGWPEPMTPAMDQTVRGRAITLHNAKNVYMKDVTVAYAPSWTIHPIYSRNLTFDNISVVSKGDGYTGAADDICVLNGDGIDPDSSILVNIFNINFLTGDDAVAIKSGRNKEGNDLDKPSSYIRITDCVSDGSKGGFVAGSENASGLRDSLFQNLTVKNIMLSHSVWLKTYWSRGGLSENLLFRDIDSSKRIDVAANYATSENNPADELPVYRYMTFENCNMSFAFEGLKASSSRPATYVENVTIRGCQGKGTIDYGKNFEIWDSYESKWSITNSDNIVFKYSNQDESVDIKVKENAEFVKSVNLEKRTITASMGTTEEQLLNDIEPLIPEAQLTFEFNEDKTILTVTSQNGEVRQEYSVSYAKVWDFSEYTTEIKTTESGFTESYDGLTIAIAGNGGDTDHDKITTSGIYWRGGDKSGESSRYIEFTPAEDGTLTVTGKMKTSGGRWGISSSRDVGTLKDDGSSSTSTSETVVTMNCKAGTTYYIINKTRAAYVSAVSYAPSEI